MPTVASYSEAAKAALLNGDAEQAAVVCRHVLRYYPKHVEANCLLAEALRDQGQANLAKDLYLRVVSADPSNLVAHWALSLIAEAEQDLEWAAWELLRAWEASPGHLELRREYQRLTGTQPSLTAFGLARLHAASGLLEKAVGELRRLLWAEPGRLDITVALAEALWRMGRHEQAAEACKGILDDSPDCLKANIMLGCWLYSGSEQAQGEGLRLLTRAQQLDPGGAVAADLLAGLTIPDILTAEPAEIPALTGEAEAAEVTEVAEEAPRPAVVKQPAAAKRDDRLVAAVAVADRGARESVVEAPRRVEEPKAPPPPAQPAQPPAQRRRGSTRADVAAWLQESGEQPATVQEVLEARLASQATQPAIDVLAIQDLDPEWQDLLTEEIALDRESEERLTRALTEMGLSEGEQAEEGWVEVKTSQTGQGTHLNDMAQSEPAAAGGISELAEVPATPASPPGAPERPAEKPSAESHDQRGSPFEQAAALWRSGKAEAALDEYRRLLDSTPGAADQVVEGLRGLIQANPDLAAAHRALGDAYMRSGRFQQAIDEYNWVLAKKRPES